MTKIRKIMGDKEDHSFLVYVMEHVMHSIPFSALHYGNYYSTVPGPIFILFLLYLFLLRFTFFSLSLGRFTLSSNSRKMNFFLNKQSLFHGQWPTTSYREFSTLGIFCCMSWPAQILCLGVQLSGKSGPNSSCCLF